MDKVKGKVDKTNKNLDDYSKRSSNTWLVIIICVQILILLIVGLVL